MAERKSLSFASSKALARDREIAHEDLRSINGEIEFLLKRAVEADEEKGKRIRRKEMPTN